MLGKPINTIFVTRFYKALLRDVFVISIMFYCVTY
jgi:hypothetical protein